MIKEPIFKAIKNSISSFSNYELTEELEFNQNLAKEICEIVREDFKKVIVIPNLLIHAWEKFNQTLIKLSLIPLGDTNRSKKRERS